MANKIEVGQVFTRLTVIGVYGPRGGDIEVRCQCGEIKRVLRAHLLSGNNKSCGCLSTDKFRERVTKHGEVKHIDGKRAASAEYRTWQNMKNRCLNLNSQDYEYYGGRGIKIADRWKEFENFLVDMGRKPDGSYTLERLNGDGDYTPDNCCWETRQTQARNRAYAATKAWELAEVLHIKPMTAHHYIWKVRAKDRGATGRAIAMSQQLEATVREHLRKNNI